MDINQIKQFSPQLIKIARKHGIRSLSIFGSVARGETSEKSDVDFLVDMEQGASLFGIAGFSYEAEKLLGIPVDVVPSSVLPQVMDRNFVSTIQKEAILL